VAEHTIPLALASIKLAGISRWIKAIPPTFSSSRFIQPSAITVLKIGAPLTPEFKNDFNHLG